MGDRDYAFSALLLLRLRSWVSAAFPIGSRSLRMDYDQLTPVPARLKKKPRASLGLVNPAFNQARRGYVSMLIEQVVNGSKS